MIDITWQCCGDDSGDFGRSYKDGADTFYCNSGGWSPNNAITTCANNITSETGDGSYIPGEVYVNYPDSTVVWYQIDDDDMEEDDEEEEEDDDED